MSTQALTLRMTRVAATAAVALAGAVLLTANASADVKALTPPAIPGVAALPGPLSPAFKTAATLGTLTTKPDIGLPGTGYSVSGTGLPANKVVIWRSALIIGSSAPILISPGSLIGYMFTAVPSVAGSANIPLRRWIWRALASRTIR